jgi:hypothetical protein
MTDLFGFGEDEAVGTTLDLIVPPDYRERHWIGYRAAQGRPDDPTRGPPERCS